ncbi:MAG: hypothetical protein LBP88_09090, partial [Treponema sp.]|nr:hypothetical protein [Treponema sp.]
LWRPWDEGPCSKPLIVGLQKRVQCTQPDNPAPPLQGVVHPDGGFGIPARRWLQRPSHPVHRHGVGCNGQVIRFNG